MWVLAIAIAIGFLIVAAIGLPLIIAVILGIIDRTLDWLERRPGENRGAASP